MERRYLLAILLSFVVVWTWSALFIKPKPAPQFGTPAAPSGPATEAGATAAIEQQSSAAPSSEKSPEGARPVLAGESERDVRVETRDVIAVITNRGARVKSWRLKHYLDREKQPQELVATVPGQPLPFTLQTANDSANKLLNNALFAVSGAPDGVLQSGSATLKFEYRDSSGLAAVKEFQFSASDYVVTFRASVTDGTNPLGSAILWGPAVGDAEPGSSYAQKPEGLLALSGKVQRLAAKDLAKQNSYEGAFKFAGVDDNYFMTVVMPAGAVKINYRQVSVPAQKPKDPPRDFVAYAVDPQQPGADLKYFVGPKDFDVLGRIDPEMKDAINFGMFKVIVVPLLQSLKWVNGFVGSYGWSIIVLTVIINVLMFPLQHKSIVSMRKMQEIQPQVKAIQDRYAKFKATDPEKQKMNQELMALYRERGVNPASGCVPMLLTMPLLLAMWAMLQTSIELRGVSFMWLPDLTQRDPIYLTPILMGATQFWQQKITPATGADPAQQRMMMIMPLVMTVMFITLPAGALIYYTVSGLLRIVQQYVTNSIIGPPTVRSVRPPAERRLKRAAGKTDVAQDRG
jgi:YidC/Oxa1 family membrane protein insertase